MSISLPFVISKEWKKGKKGNKKIINSVTLIIMGVQKTFFRRVSYYIQPLLTAKQTCS